MTQVEAVIFDMDGVIIDSEPFYGERARAFFDQHGYQVPPHEILNLAGGSHQFFLECLHKWWELSPRKSAAELANGLVWSMDQWEKNLPPIDHARVMFPEVPRALRAFADRGIRLAVASSSPRASIDRALEACDITRFFELVVSGAELAESKPNPAIYLRTLELLELAAEDCVAVEDSDRGIEAARRAGLRVAIRRDERFGYVQEGGTWKIDTLDELVDLL